MFTIDIHIKYVYHLYPYKRKKDLNFTNLFTNSRKRLGSKFGYEDKASIARLKTPSCYSNSSQLTSLN